MKLLTLLRHAKTESADQYDSDEQRPLTARGHEDAITAGTFLVQLEPAIDLIVSSPVVRARETTERVIDAGTSPLEVNWDQRVYGASAGSLLDVLRKTPVKIGHLLVVGHNPGMEDLAARLIVDTPHTAALRMPTAAIASFRLRINHWSELDWGSGQLQLLTRPKYLQRSRE